MAVIDWPGSILRLQDATYHLAYKTRSGGRSLSGVDQVISPGVAVWEVTYSLAREFDGTRLRQFETLVSRMRGRSGIGAFPVCDPYRYSSRVSPAQQPYSDGTWHTDGTGFIAPGPASMTVAAAAAAGARFVQLALTNPTQPLMRVGDMFSHDGFLYRVQWAAGNTVQVAPDLRRPIVAGAVLATDPPVFYGRFATDDEGRRAREMLRWGAATTINLVEALDR